jgi:hypothetical protein
MEIWPRIKALINNAKYSQFYAPFCTTIALHWDQIICLLFCSDDWQVGHHSQVVLFCVYYFLTTPDSMEEGALQIAVMIVSHCFVSEHSHLCGIIE